jgi:DNA-binding response OmpR family regulator
MNRTTVLVIDDSPEALEMLNTALSSNGMTVLLALSAAQAFSITEAITPDVFVVDAQMPVMDGFDCCKLLRQRFPLTPILFMTGLTDSESLKKAFDKGANDYLVKPVKPPELITRITFHQQKACDFAALFQALEGANQPLFSVNNSGNISWVTPDIEDTIQALLRFDVRKRC